jgi:hypothetical protein
MAASNRKGCSSSSRWCRRASRAQPRLVHQEGSPPRQLPSLGPSYRMDLRRSSVRGARVQDLAQPDDGQAGMCRQPTQRVGDFRADTGDSKPPDARLPSGIVTGRRLSWPFHGGQTLCMSTRRPRWRIDPRRALAILVSAGLLFDAVGSWWNEDLPLFVKLLYKTVAEPFIVVLVLRRAWRSPKPPGPAAWSSKSLGPSSTGEDPPHQG